MIAADTNVLVRLIVGDDEHQAAIAKDLLETASATGVTCLVSNIVLAELVWVLDSCYDVPKSEIVTILRELLSNMEFDFESRSAVSSALDAYASGKADFSDYLIGSSTRERGAAKVYTFDRELRRADGFEVLRSP